MTFRRNVALSVASVLALGVVSNAAAQTVVDPTKPAPPAEPKPADGPPSPLSLTASYTADLLGDVNGGADPGAGYVDLLKLSATYDGATAGRAGLTALISLEHAFGSGFTARRVDGVQNISSNEAEPGSVRLYEAWVQQEVLQGRGAVKAGLVDLNTTFDVQETAALFLNASHGIGPEIGDTGLNGPSEYPTPALAVTAVYRPAEGWTAQIGVFDGVAGDPNHRSAFVAVKLAGALIAGQIEKRFGDVARIEAGAWTYTAAFPALDRFDAAGTPRLIHGDDGVYGLAEGRLLPKSGKSDGGLSGWVRAGLANGDINVVDSYLGAGLVYTGLVRGRDKDEIGLSIARAGIGRGARHAGLLAGDDIGDAETDFEITYRYVAKDWLNIQPDVQYVVNPHGDRRTPDALVLGLRLAFTYSK